jgi:hypothetical protein
VRRFILLQRRHGPISALLLSLAPAQGIDSGLGKGILHVPSMALQVLRFL